MTRPYQARSSWSGECSCAALVIDAGGSNRELLSATTAFGDGTIIVQDRTALARRFLPHDNVTVAVEIASRRDVIDDHRGAVARSARRRHRWLHSITSSAATSSVCGAVRPSALAVLRLMIISNLVGRSTGRSAGWKPCKILPTMVPT